MRKAWITLWAMLAVLALPPATATAQITMDDLLPVEQAFALDGAVFDDVVVLRWAIADGYYLYRHAFEVEVEGDGVVLAAPQIPPGEMTVDEFFGETETYRDEIEIVVPIVQASAGAHTLRIRSQGCADLGVCYPPHRQTLTLNFAEIDGSAVAEGAPPAAAVSPPERPLAEQDRLAAALTGTPLLALSLFLVAGLLLAFTPCVFPMVPILSGLIAGEGDQITTARAFRLSAVYVLAMALVYTAFGVVAGLFGQNLQAVFQHPAVLSSFALLFVVLSLAMFGFYELQLPSSWQTRLNQLSNRAEGGTLMGAAIMGALSALIVGPCVAPALMGALIYIGQTGDAVLGGAALFSMALGMGIPLVVWGTSAGRLLPRAGAWMSAVKAVFGVGLLALAIWMLERVLPAPVIMLAWGALAIACAVYLGALTRLGTEASGWQRLWQALGVVLLIAGSAQLVGALSGGQDWTRPLHHLSGGGSVASVTAPEFRVVDTLDELEQALATAPGPTFLDVYADWCVDCVRMARRTFPDPQVAERMADFTLLKIDVTAYNTDDQAMLSAFGLIGPPAYLFFDQGAEHTDLRSFGFMAPARFAAVLDQARGR